MIAAETTEGLERLGIVHHTTLPYSPEQNGKQESFWGQIEGRLLPMLEGEPELTLDLLNTASQAWVEQEYHRKEHSEMKETPLARYLRGPSVGRDGPSSDALPHGSLAKAATQRRHRHRRRDPLRGPLRLPHAPAAPPSRRAMGSVERRSRRSALRRASRRPAPARQDAHAERVRRVLAPVDDQRPRRAGIAPHLRALMAEYAATGLPPAFVPKDASTALDDDSSEDS